MHPLDISSSALAAQRLRMNVIASNIANANTTRDPQGRNIPYRRMEVLFAATEDTRDVGGVRVAGIQGSANPYKWVHQPSHPDAIKDPQSEHYGMVLTPRINVVQEMVDMMLASRAYEANLTAMEVTKAMSNAVSRIIA